MKKFRKTIFAVLFTGSLLVQFSCAPVACFDETNAFLKASFYLDSTRAQTTPDSVTLYGTGMDTNKIYEAKENLKQALIPLNASTSNCSWFLELMAYTIQSLHGIQHFRILFRKHVVIHFIINLIPLKTQIILSPKS